MNRERGNNSTRADGFPLWSWDQGWRVGWRFGVVVLSSASREVFSGNRRGYYREEKRRERTGLLLLDGKLGPAALHAVTEGHPEVGLLLKGHALPSLLNVLERRVGQGLGGIGSTGRGPAQDTRSLGAEHDCVSGGGGGANWVDEEAVEDAIGALAVVGGRAIRDGERTRA